MFDKPENPSWKFFFFSLSRSISRAPKRPLQSAPAPPKIKQRKTLSKTSNVRGKSQLSQPERTPLLGDTVVKEAYSSLQTVAAVASSTAVATDLKASGFVPPERHNFDQSIPAVQESVASTIKDVTGELSSQ